MISEEKLNALFVMSKAWMESKQTIDDLFQDDIEDFGMCFELDIKKKPDRRLQASIFITGAMNENKFSTRATNSTR